MEYSFFFLRKKLYSLVAVSGATLVVVPGLLLTVASRCRAQDLGHGASGAAMPGL